MAGGWMIGLGQGLQNVAGTISDYAKQRQMMQQQALENALRERQLRQQEDEASKMAQYRQGSLDLDKRRTEAQEADREDALWAQRIWPNMQADAEVDPETEAAIPKRLLGAMTQKTVQNRPMEAPAIPAEGIDSATSQGIVPGLEVPTTMRTWRPTETAATRAKMETDAQRIQVAMAAIQQREAASQRLAELRRYAVDKTNAVAWANYQARLQEAEQDAIEADRQAKLAWYNLQLRNEGIGINRDKAARESSIVGYDGKIITTPGAKITTPRTVLPEDPESILPRTNYPRR